MGVEKTTYLMFGIKLNKEQGEFTQKNWSDEKLNLIKYVEGRPEVHGWTLIFDGMCCQDHFFGKVLGRMDDYVDTPYTVIGDPLKRCEEFKKLFKEKFDDCFSNKVELGDMEPQLMLINHFY